MSVFDTANNMKPATEQDEFSVIQITQPEMDELAELRLHLIHHTQA